MVFDWNRPGEPETGGAAGQGFLRIRHFGDRFYVPDADPPYLGFGFAHVMAEGYVFESDANARFSRARSPGHLPPAPPTSKSGGAIVLPGAIHVFDVVRFRKRLLVSTGALVPPKRAETSPGALLAQNETSGEWQPVYTYAHPARAAAARLGYMIRFRDRLYVAVSPLEPGDPNEYVVLDAELRPTVVTVVGARHTLRWYTDSGRLYWISIGGNGSELRVTSDGQNWKLLPLPNGAGGPTDILRVGKSLVVLAERGLYSLSDSSFHELGRVTEAKSPFSVDDAYCAAPLVAFRGELYAGGQRRGTLYRLSASSP